MGWYGMDDEWPEYVPVFRRVAAARRHVEQRAEQSGRAAGKSGIFIVGALSMAAMGGVFLLVTLAYVLVALGLPVWAGFGIVTLVLFLVAAVLGLLGKKASPKTKGPDRTIAQIEQTKAALQSAVEQPADVQRALPER